MNIINKIRKEQEITQEKLAELSGLHKNTVQNIETDRVIPDITSIICLSKALGIDNSIIMNYYNDIKNGK